MPIQKMDALGDAQKMPTWLGTYETDLRGKTVRLPTAWRPKTPLSIVCLVWDSPDDIRMVWLISQKQLDQHLNANDDKERILAQDEIMLKPDGLIRLPDIFLEGFSDLSNAHISLVGMCKHIEIYRQEDREKLDSNTMTLLDELCQHLENRCQSEDV